MLHRQHTDDNRRELLGRIADQLYTGQPHVPDNAEALAPALNTLSGHRDTHGIAQGQHNIDPITWTLFELRTPHSANSPPDIWLRYKQWGTHEDSRRARIGIGIPSLTGTGLNTTFWHTLTPEVVDTPPNPDSTTTALEMYSGPIEHSQTGEVVSQNRALDLAKPPRRSSNEKHDLRKHSDTSCEGSR